MTPLLNFSHITDNNGSQIGSNTTMTHENQNFKTVNDFNMSNVTTSVTPSKFLPINDSISSMPYSKYNKSTIIDTNHLSSSPLPTPENNASPSTRRMNNNINANKDLYPITQTVIKFF